MSIRQSLDYIEQDNREAGSAPMTDEKDEKRMKFWQCFSYKQTWAFVFGKFMTDGVWWFFLFWTPSYLNTQFGIKTSDPLGMALIFTLYAVTMLSIYGGKLPTIFINRTGMNPYAARMKAMLIFAFFPLVVLLAQPLGTVSPWFPVILIGIGGACSSILVGQYILYRRRYVPKNSYCKYHRYRWYGRRRRLYDSSESGR